MAQRGFAATAVRIESAFSLYYRVSVKSNPSTQENALQQFIAKYRDQITGVLSGFDRLVFRGSLRRLNYGWWCEPLGAVVAKGMEEYLWQNQILFQDYARHVKRVSERLKDESLKAFRKQGLPVIFLRSSSVDKDELARNVATERKISSGLVCAISSLEPSPTFEHRGTHIIRRERPCHVLYHYQIDPEVGWMYGRIQTWFPFNIQMGLNGREWLAQRMKKEGLPYRQQGNCFVWIEDYERAQEWMNEQLQVNWAEVLNRFGQQLNPIREAIFARYPTDYYWTCYQSEWATDIVFREAEFLKRLMPMLVRQSVLSFSSTEVMRYFGKKVNQSGQIPGNFGGTLQADLRKYQEGERVKYRLNGNSAKFYDKAYNEVGSVLRGAETTINTVKDFRVYRPKEGGPEEDLQWRPMRRGIADLHRRAEVSQKTNERLLDALARLDDSRRVEELTASIQRPTTWGGRRVRALRPLGDDKDLLAAVNHGEFLINGLRNRDLQQLLYHRPAESRAEQRRRSAAVSRKLRLLRAHGLIRKVPGTHRYHITEAGRSILVAALTAAKATVCELNQLQQKAA
ncbi:MAG TPA: hypothetical protein VLE03_00740 [Nitrospiraceae bacterium]|nr:hypothetical protein [Nitrospiraceae bacterium]